MVASRVTAGFLPMGNALLEVSEIPHTGCKKFAERYGTEAVKFINAANRKHLHLRGIYARIVKAGNIHIGNVIRKV
jgi:MOSC domain-containing protein YiiM